jgi:hypothetical protein
MDRCQTSTATGSAHFLSPILKPPSLAPSPRTLPTPPPARHRFQSAPSRRGATAPAARTARDTNPVAGDRCRPSPARSRRRRASTRWLSAAQAARRTAAVDSVATARGTNPLSQAGRVGTERDGPSPCLPVVSLFVRPQYSVDAALISCSSLTKPFQDIRVDAQYNLRLAHDGLQSLTNKGLCEFLRGNLGKVGKVDLSILHSIDPLPVTPRSLRSSFAPHASLPFLSR